MSTGEPMIPYPEPAWGASQPAYEDCSALVAMGVTPFLLTGALVRLLQYHFSDPVNIIHDSLRIYRWKPSCTEGIVSPDGQQLIGLHVGVSYEFDTSAIQQRPAVFVKREPVTVQRVAAIQDDRSLPATNRDGLYPGKHLQKTVDGRFSILAISTSGTEADLLGEEVFLRMLFFAPIIRNDLNIGQFTVEGMSDVREVDGVDGVKDYYVSVSIYWANVMRWGAVPETPVLKRIRLVQNNLVS